MAALSDNFVTVNAAVDLLEDAYEVVFLKGNIAFNRGDYEGAVSFADLALKFGGQHVLPNEVAARSLRVAARIYAGQEDYAVMHGGELLTLVPNDDVDHRLMANALLRTCPEHALRVLESALSVRYSANRIPSKPLFTDLAIFVV